MRKYNRPVPDNIKLSDPVFAERLEACIRNTVPAAMSKIVFNVNSSKSSYVSALQTALETAGYTVTVSGTTVTVTLATPATSINFQLTAQTRFDSIVVYA